MDLISNVHTRLAKKAISLPLILIFSICLFVTTAFSGDCSGDENCFDCGQMGHRHEQGAEMVFMLNGCQSGAQSSNCGIANNQISDRQSFLVSAIRAEIHEDSSIPASPALDYSSDLLSKGFISRVHFSVVTYKPPIYLLNLSLLC